MKKTIIMFTACLCVMSGEATAQRTTENRNSDRRPQFGGNSGRSGLMWALPIIKALDSDGNKEISSLEIQRSADALKKLDKNKDGKLTEEEIRPSFGGNPIRREGNAKSVQPPTNNKHSPIKALPIPKTIGGLEPKEILALFGAKGREGATARMLNGYRRVFGFTDANKDGKHSKKEYIEGGRYLTRESRTGIFNASDSNHDDFVSEEEYVENRIITDEAKEIFSSMDADKNNKLTTEEIVTSKKLKDEKLARDVFKAFDINGDGELIIPEYLRVWGSWARL